MAAIVNEHEYWNFRELILERWFKKKKKLQYFTTIKKFRIMTISEISETNGSLKTVWRIFWKNFSPNKLHAWTCGLTANATKNCYNLLSDKSKHLKREKALNILSSLCQRKKTPSRKLFSNGIALTESYRHLAVKKITPSETKNKLKKLNAQLEF